MVDENEDRRPKRMQALNPLNPKSKQQESVNISYALNDRINNKRGVGSNDGKTQQLLESALIEPEVIYEPIDVGSIWRYYISRPVDGYRLVVWMNPDGTVTRWYDSESISGFHNKGFKRIFP